jgi:hypothetical protein
MKTAFAIAGAGAFALPFVASSLQLACAIT